MPGEPRALRRRHGLARTGSSADDPAHTLSARVPAPAQTLASVTTQGRCGGEEQQGGTVGVVVGKGCLKRLGCAASGGGSGAAKKVSFASEPQVRVMSPPAAVQATGRRRGRGTLSSAEVVGGYTTAPVRRSMRIAANLGVGVEQVTVAACNSAKFEEGGDAGETVDRKRKRNSKENSEHMSVSTQIGVSRRSTRSSGVDKKVTFKLVGQPAAEVAGFKRRPRVAADGEGDAGEAGSTAPLRWSRRNAVNVGVGDGVKRIAGAVSRKISAKALEEEEDAVDRKAKARENVEDIGYVWLLPNIATTNFSQIMSATKSVANKMATKVVASFGKKLSPYHVDDGAKKVGQATVVATDQIDA